MLVVDNWLFASVFSSVFTKCYTFKFVVSSFLPCMQETSKMRRNLRTYCVCFYYTARLQSRLTLLFASAFFASDILFCFCCNLICSLAAFYTLWINSVCYVCFYLGSSALEFGVGELIFSRVLSYCLWNRFSSLSRL